MIKDYNWAVLVKAPEKEGVPVPTEERVKELIRQAENMEVEPYQDEQIDAPLLESEPVAGQVKSKRKNEKGGFTEVLFENGAKLILKPNDYQNDQLLFSAFSPGGHSVYPDSLFMNAKYTASVISMSGVGPFNSIQLQKKLAGNTASVSPWINSLQEGLEGSCSPSDLETLLKLNYLYFTDSRVDTSAFQSFISRIENQVANLKANPRYLFRDTLVDILTSNHPRKQLIPSKEDIAELDMGTIHEIFTGRFANAGDFTFLFVGNFQEDSLMPLVEKYIGSLPASSKTEQWEDVEPGFPKGKIDFALHKGMEPKSLVVLAMNGKLKWKYEERLHFSLLDNILSIKLRQSMREEKSGVYGVGVSTSTEKFPDPEYDLQVSFGCSPQNVDSLIEVVFLEMKKLQDEGPIREDLVKVKETAINDREVAIEKNSYWINHLENHYFRGDDIISMAEFKELVESVTAKDIQKAAKRYFTMDAYVRAVLYPAREE
jgi:zinc protease